VKCLKSRLTSALPKQREEKRNEEKHEGNLFLTLAARSQCGRFSGCVAGQAADNMQILRDKIKADKKLLVAATWN